MRRTSILAAAAMTAWLAAPPAHACTVSATGVAFGAYDTLSAAPDDGTGSIVLVCHPNVHAPSVELDAGLSGLFSPRRMNSGAAALDYNLYTSATRLIVWGNGLGGSVAVTLTGGGVTAGQRTFERTIYGRIPAGQSVPAGTYGDTIVVTVVF